MGQFFAYAFYAFMLFSALYFCHKVLWYFRYQYLQQKLVNSALARLAEQADETVGRWDREAASTWSEAAQGVAANDYVASVESRLRELSEKLDESHTRIADRLVERLSTPQPTQHFQVLKLPQLEGPALLVETRLDFTPLVDPPMPDPEELSLETTSRYSFLRRILALLLGAADVVYSTQHVVLMSQNSAAPKGLLLRRLSLVILILLAMAIDVGFGVRFRLVDWASRWCEQVLGLHEGFLHDYLPSAIGLVAWLLAYGSLYLALYGVLRFQSSRAITKLKRRQETYPAEMEAIRQRHRDQLIGWMRDYGESLDRAGGLTIERAQMLVDHTRIRLRQHVASEQLLTLADEVAERFFAKLPESSTKLQDVATSRKHSVWYWFWPNEKEMKKYQVAIAQYRHTWRDIRMCVTQLRGSEPDPAMAEQLWSSLVRYADMFREVIAGPLLHELKEAYYQRRQHIVGPTEADLVELSARIVELHEGFARTVESIGPLVRSQIQLTQRLMDNEVSEFHAESLTLREHARLEAMAFEI